MTNPIELPTKGADVRYYLDRIAAMSSALIGADLNSFDSNTLSNLKTIVGDDVNAVIAGLEAGGAS